MKKQSLDPAEKPKSTILIPTYHRAQYLRRSLTYMKTHFDLTTLPIIVLDGSDGEAAEENKQICAELGIRYEWFGPDVPHYERWLRGLELVETDIVSFMPDDDCYGPQGYWQGVNWLADGYNNDYAAAFGLTYQYNYNLDKGNFTLEPFMYWWLASVEDDFPLDRVANFYYNYADLTYALHRTRLLKKVMRDVIDHVDPRYFVFMEYLMNAVIPLHGKIKAVNAPYLYRAMNTNFTHHKLYFDFFLYTHDFVDQFEKMMQGYLKHTQALRLHEEHSRHVFYFAFNQYLSRVVIPYKRSNVHALRLCRITSYRSIKKPIASYYKVLSDVTRDLLATLQERWAFHRNNLPKMKPQFRGWSQFFLSRNKQNKELTDFMTQYHRNHLSITDLETGAATPRLAQEIAEAEAKAKAAH